MLVILSVKIKIPSINHKYIKTLLKQPLGLEARTLILKLLTLYCLSAALSIALSQAALLSAVIIWVLVVRDKELSLFHGKSQLFIKYLSLWFVAAAISAVSGVDPMHSIITLLKTGLYLLIPIVVAEMVANHKNYIAIISKLLLAFIAGQSVAALHTSLSAILNYEIPLGIPGAVTESGQLTLVLPLILAYLYLNNDLIAKERTLKKIIIFACLLLTSALVINLKRGPWAGVSVECLLVGVFLSRMYVLIPAAIFSTLFIIFTPIRERIFSLIEHFTIQGGRQYMWEMGLELIQRFPLGIGLGNSRFMRVLDPNLPELHRHMHNNLLNIMVETGWFGLLIYLLFMYHILTLGFIRMPDNSSDKTTLILSTALIGWQVAGLVEYNFGDGEVRMIAFFIMGLLLALYYKTQTRLTEIN
jgi:O-antigen ligase